MSTTELKDVVEIIQGIATTLGIVLAGLWTFWLFVYSRSFAGTITAKLSLKNLTHLDGTPVAIISIQLKNVGRTRAKKGYCLLAVEPINKPVFVDRSYFLSTHALDYTEAQTVFESLVELEPGEEVVEEVVLILSSRSIIKVGLKFKHKNTKETWECTTVVDATEITT